MRPGRIREVEKAEEGRTRRKRRIIESIPPTEMKMRSRGAP